MSEYKQPRQYIHVQPFACNQEIPDYDMDCEDVKFLEEELLSRRKMDVNHFTFEDMMDKLEKNSRVNAVTIKEAKLILKEDDDLILLVYDYWLNKRLATQQSLVPSIKTVNYSQTHNPYVCFRRRTEKMMTRKNRKNEEASYEAMLKLRRDLSRAVTLLDMVRRREKTKKEKLNLTLDIFNKRYNSKDWDGRMLDSVTSSLSRQRLQPSGLNVHNWISMWSQSPPRRSQHSHKMKRRLGGRGGSPRLLESPTDKMISSEDEIGLLGGGSEDEMERGNPFLFTRKEGVEYHAPLDLLQPPDLSHHPDEAFVLTGLRLSRGLRCLGYCRRRVGRGGRVVLDRLDRLEANYGQGEVTTMTRAVTPPGLEDDMDWDPYMTRQQEEEVSTSATTTTQFNNNKGFKIVDMNRAVAHNAAGALIPSQFVGQFYIAMLTSTTQSSNCLSFFRSVFHTFNLSREDMQHEVSSREICISLVLVFVTYFYYNIYNKSTFERNSNIPLYFIIKFGL